MQRLRTVPRFVRMLVALFVIAQFAGVTASPLARAQEAPGIAGSHLHNHHADHSHDNKSVNHTADPCCGLHAFFVGVLPAVIAVGPVDACHQRLVAALSDAIIGIDPGRLDRPPRPFAVI
jgi:hypothetical protein